MRLTAIKLAGFKSFVDSTTFRAPSNLTGIVGPNGCGKSNIIDAVRWVMGEGSARVLRGELMSDVIFSGSSTRKPVGTATVELLFDNADGKIGGEFAGYNEISVRRQVGRDGISLYALNGTRCRRKDIRDLFLGTGLGSRSYSIIEQGMISQIVDARPEDIRAHLEEAAGISRYKERRRETENRIQHTRDNLDRLSDLREEVGNHLSRLKRQARAAERYRKLKQQQRELRSKMLALQWREQMNLANMGKTGLAVQETALQEHLAELRAAESEMEKLHLAQAEASEAFNAVQGELYAVASDIARLEQGMQHAREMQAQQEKEYEEISASLKDLEQHMLLDRAQVGDLTSALAEMEPALADAESAESAADRELGDAEGEVQAWQEGLERHHKASNELNRRADSLRAALEVLDQRMVGADSRLQELRSETESVETGALSDEQADMQRQCREAGVAQAEAQQVLIDARAGFAGFTEQLRESTEREHDLQGSLNAREGRLEALRSLQQASSDGGESRQWLEGQRLLDAPQLVSVLKTEPGWERAVETVLGHWLEALVVDGIIDPASGIDQLNNAALGLVHESSGTVRQRSGTLAEKVHAPDAITAVLNHVRVAEALPDALEFLDVVGDEESAITREGEWIGPGWARVARGPSAQAGMLEREQEISSLREEVASLHQQWESLRLANEKKRDTLPAMEARINALQEEANERHRYKAQLDSLLAASEARIEDLSRRGEQIARETATLSGQQHNDTQQVRQTRKELDAVLEEMAASENVRQQLDVQRKILLEGRDAARTAAREARDKQHELALEVGSRRASLDSLNQSLERMDTQVSQLQLRYLALSESIAKATDPEQEFRGEMDALLQQRVDVEARLARARQGLQDLEEEYRQQDAVRQQAVQESEELRGALERARLRQQEVELDARNLQRRVDELGENVTELAEDLPGDAQSEQWEADIERLGIRITRLEPANLAAISEYEEELKRKEYLDAQNDDLVEALETLEAAIAKIDRKTRTRFKDTFEMVNKGLQDLFPTLFGGGHAYLEMTGEDLLTTGVAIMARPPGKRVSSIHLLSGGEKALTAVSFVFAIFRLNPSPFCLLDEVDAPLDDANVGRFSALVQEMSETVQFVIVTHNKITMEMVHQLSGVTMQEPGVSRLVQVDIDEAARLAAC